MPTTLLAVDTATDRCSVALAFDDVVDEQVETVGHRHSERILPMVRALLDAHRLRLADCDAVAFGAGPGAFTGLRIACGIAQGLAYGIGRPVIPVGNLAALALAASREHPLARRILTAIDARMEEIYWAAFAIESRLPRQLSAPALSPAAELPELVQHWGPDLIAGNAVSMGQRSDAGWPCATAPQACPGAGAIAALGRVALASGQAVPAALAAPVYVRDRVALTIDERRAGAQL